MYIQSSTPFSYSAYDDKALPLENRESAMSSEKKSQNSVQADFSAKKQEIESENSSRSPLGNFSEKAVLVFESLTAEFTAKQKEDAAKALNSIAKAAAFASINGYESQSERLLVAQYFGNFEGVLSDDAIKKIIYSKLNNSDKSEESVFLEKFASAMDEPLQRINIRA